MKKVLITGATGLVGENLSLYLHKLGYDVTGMARRHREKSYPYRMVYHDIAVPLDIEEKFDIIVHAAASLPYNTESISTYIQNNIEGTRNLIKFAKTHQVNTVIYMSTIGVHGEFRSEHLNEDSDKINLEGYGLTKYIGELLLKEGQSFKSISIRTPGIIAKGARGIWLPNTVDKFRKHEDVKIYSPEFLTKNFVYVDDLVKFIAVLLEKERFSYDTVMLGCSKGNTVLEIVNRIKQLTQSMSRIVVDNTIRKSFCIDNSRAVEMGYRSLEPLEIVDAYCASLGDILR